MTWRERLEMPPERFTRIWLSKAGCEAASQMANAHLDGLAEVLERVEAVLSGYVIIPYTDGPARDALSLLRAWRDGGGE